MTGRILWRFAERSELLGECGDVTAWLSAGEQRRLTCVRNTASREASALGRVAIKQLLLAECAVAFDPTALELVSQDAQGRGVRPTITIAERRLPWSVSISHTETAVLVALATEPGVVLGVDLVREDATAAQSLQSWFDPAEQELLATGDAWEACRLWAIKEAVYKAANHDDSFAPRRVEIRRTPRGPYRATYRRLDLDQCCQIETRALPGHVAAMVQVACSGSSFLPLVERDFPTLAH